jgi:PAS domain S-box-containing protein
VRLAPAELTVVSGAWHRGTMAADVSDQAFPPTEFEAFVAAEVAAGRYADTTAVLRAALGLLAAQPSPPAARGALPRFPAGSGIMAEKVRAYDWASSPTGPIETWPACLHVAVDMMLASSFPQCLFWGPDLIAIYNDGYVPLLGQKPDALGRPFRETWSEAWEVLRPIAQRAMDGEATFIEDFAMKTDRSGRTEQAFFTFCYSPVRNENGTVMGIMDTVVETTGKVLAERQLREERRRLDELNADLERQVAERTADRNRLWRLSADIMLVAQPDGIVVAVNPAWSAVLGWTERELVGRDTFELIHPDDIEGSRRAAAEVASGKPLGRFDNRYRHRDSSYRWIAWTAVQGGGLVNAVGRDFTAEKARTEALALAEEALRQSQKMEAVGQLTGGLAHDFNNLLTSIGGSLELLGLRVAQGRVQDLDRYVAAAQGATRRAAALTHRLLAFSRRQTLDPKLTDVNRLVAGIEELIRRTIGPAVSLEVVAAPGLWTVLVDPNQLENALLNLCINARDAMPDGGHLVIESANTWLDEAKAGERELAPGPYLTLSVTDTGTGMPPEVIERAFDPFFTTKPIGMGTGLGLSMAYGFVRQSNGQLRISSEVGRGSTLCLYLPRHMGEVAGGEAPEEPVTTQRTECGLTVLVVDDEATVRMLLTEVLQELGHATVEATDGAAALKVLQSDQRIALLVTDVGLPGGMNGRQVADAARATRPDLKILFITGYAETAVLGHGHLEAGMEVLTKPFAMETLTARIRDMMAEA